MNYFGVRQLSRKNITILLFVCGGIAVGVTFASYYSIRGVDQEPSTGVFICRQSKDLFIGDIPTGEAVHPLTGHVLAAAVYCPCCQAWQVAPPVSLLYRNPKAIECPKCQVPRTFIGDLPANAIEL